MIGSIACAQPIAAFLDTFVFFSKIDSAHRYGTMEDYQMKTKLIGAMLAACSLAMILSYSVAARAQQYVYPQYPDTGCPGAIPSSTYSGPYIPNPSFECPGIPQRADVGAIPGVEWGGMFVFSGQSFVAGGLVHQYPTLWGGVWNGGGDYIIGWNFVPTSGGPGPHYFSYIKNPSSNAGGGGYSIIYSEMTPGTAIGTTIQQLTGGVLYKLSFDLLQNPYATEEDRQAVQFIIKIGSDPEQAILNAYSYPPSWQTHDLFFTAPQGGTAQLSFSRSPILRATKGLVDNFKIVAMPMAPLKVVKLVSPDPQNIGSSLTFSVEAHCINPGNFYTQFHPVSVNSSATLSVPVDLTCTVVEASPLPALPTGCTWLTPVVAPASILITQTPGTVTVTNGYDCVPPPHVLTVTKTVSPDPLGVGNGMSFSMTVNCTVPAGSPPPSVTKPVPANGSAAWDVPANSTCQVTENDPKPALPQWCFWHDPVSSPPSATMTGAAASIAVTNSYECKPPLTEMKVSKEVTVLPPAVLPSQALTFNVTVACANPTVVTSTGTYSQSQGFIFKYPPAPDADNMQNVPLGSTCNASEDDLKPVANAACPSGVATWDTTYSPASISISNHGNAIIVRNKLACSTKIMALHIYKQIVNNTSAVLAPALYPVTALCGANTYPLALNTNSPTIVWNQPPGAHCKVTEDVHDLPLPNGGCPLGKVPAWQQPVISPTDVYLGVQSTITVKNTLNCVSKLVGPGSGLLNTGLKPVLSPDPTDKKRCKEPLVRNPAGACACPDGTAQRGRNCVKPVVCIPPAKLNRRGACECPKGMVLRGNACIDPKRDQSDRLPKDNSKNVPGVFTPGRDAPKRPAAASRGGVERDIKSPGNVGR